MTMFKRLLILMLFVFALGLRAQGQIRITDLPSASAVTDDDLLVVVDAPGGTATTKKIVFSSFTASINRLGLNTSFPTTAGQVSSILGANAITGFSMKRFTDTSPTGKFVDFLNAAGGSVASIDINGNLAVTSCTGCGTGGGSGDVVGPASATDNAIVRFDGTTGKLMQNSAVTIDDTSGAITGFKDKGGQVFNVKAYGAVGDGTTNDLTALQAANTAAAAVKGTVYLPPGTYAISASFVPSAEVSIVGAGRKSTFLKALAGFTSGTGLISVSSVDRVVVQNIGFVSNGQAARGVNINASTDSVVAYCHFDSGLYDAVTLEGGSRRCVIDHIVSDGSTTIENVSFIDVSYCELTHSHIKGSGGGRNGIEVYLNTPGELVGNRIIGNYFESTGGAGVALLGDTGTVVSGNTVTSPGTYGIYAESRTISTVVYPSTGGSFTGNTVIGGPTGIQTTGGVKLSVSGNSVRNTTSHGIIAAGNYNTISANSVSNAGGIGIYVPGSYNQIAGNIVTDSFNAGIDVAGDSNSVAGNTSTDTRTSKVQTYGIFFESGADNNTYGANKLTGNLSGDLLNSGTGNALRESLILADGVGIGTGATAPANTLTIRNNSPSYVQLGEIAGTFGGIGFGSTALSTANYSLAGDGTNTLVNVPTGGTVYFKVNNANIGTWDNTALTAIGLIKAGSGPTTLTSAAGKVLIAAIDATGTPSSSTYLRGDGTWTAPSGAGTVTNTGGALTANQVVLGNGSADIKVLGSLGTTTTVLHGNAAGAPTFAAVNLANDVTGTLADGSLSSNVPLKNAGNTFTAIQTVNVSTNAGSGSASAVSASMTGTGSLNGTYFGLDFTGLYTGTGATNAVYGISGAATISNSVGGTSIIAVNGDADNATSSTVGTVIGAQGGITNSSSGTITVASSVKAIANSSGTGTVAALRGLDVSGWTNSATVTTSYGIYMDTSIDVGATKYALYSLSTSPSLLTGTLRSSNLGLNVASPTSGGQILSTLGANNITGLEIKRFTDTSATGKFFDFKNAAGTSVASMDIAGNLTVVGCTGCGTGGGGSPGGSGSEVQYRGGASTFSAVTGSSVSGGQVTLADKLTATLDNATTNVADTLIDIQHSSSGTVAAGFGAGVRFGLESSTTANRDAGAISVAWSDVTDGSRTSYMSFYGVYNGGAMEEVGRVGVAPNTAWNRGFQDFASGVARNYYGGNGNDALIYSPNSSIFLTNNFGAGLKFSYGRDDLNLDSSLSIGGTGGIYVWNGDTGTSNVATEFGLKRNIAGTPAAGYGEALKFALKSSTTADQDAASIAAVWTTATHGSRTADLVFSTVNNATAIAEAGRFTGAGNLTVTGTVTAAGNVLGTREILQNSQSAAYTLVLADSGKHIYHPSADTTARTWTIPANGSVAFPVGTAITFVNDTSAGVITIAITTDTLVLAGAGTTGSRTLAAGGVATAVKVTSTRWIISGTGLT